jgi:hypothetical protein
VHPGDVDRRPADIGPRRSPPLPAGHRPGRSTPTRVGQVGGHACESVWRLTRAAIVVEPPDRSSAPAAPPSDCCTQSREVGDRRRTSPEVGAGWWSTTSKHARPGCASRCACGVCRAAARSNCRRVLSLVAQGQGPEDLAGHEVGACQVGRRRTGLPAQPGPEGHPGAVDQIVDDLGHDDLAPSAGGPRWPPRDTRAASARGSRRTASVLHGARGPRAGPTRRARRPARSSSTPSVSPEFGHRQTPPAGRAGGVRPWWRASPSSSRSSSATPLQLLHPRPRGHGAARDRGRPHWPPRGSARSCLADLVGHLGQQLVALLPVRSPAAPPGRAGS